MIGGRLTHDASLRLIVCTLGDCVSVATCAKGLRLCVETCPAVQGDDASGLILTSSTAIC